MAKQSNRIDVLKTYKMYVDGKFPRSESGRYYKLESPGGKLVANVCLASRKDFRDAVVAARKGFPGWSGRSAYNRGQILYRIAETLEGRKTQFVSTLVAMGVSSAAASREVEQSIDLIVHYAGWCDKYQQVFSSVNPVESSHFNFSFPEPMGVIAVLAPRQSALLGLTAAIMPCIAGGNTVIVLAAEKMPLTAVEFAEVIHASDVPAGTVNILTGKEQELAKEMGSHMDVNAVVTLNDDQVLSGKLGELASLNVKRVLNWSRLMRTGKSKGDPYAIMDLQEIKTTWHPVGM